LEKVVDRCKRSGKGHGSVADDVVEEEQSDGTFEKQCPAECGRFTSEVQLEVGDLRSNCLRAAPVHILCCWHLADIQDIVRDVLSRMGAKACASSAKPASETALVQKKRRNSAVAADEELIEEKKFRSSVGTAMSSVACDSVVLKWHFRSQTRTLPTQERASHCFS
jgi:hypothetical protein